MKEEYKNSRIHEYITIKFQLQNFQGFECLLKKKTEKYKFVIAVYRNDLCHKVLCNLPKYYSIPTATQFNTHL